MRELFYPSNIQNHTQSFIQNDVFKNYDKNIIIIEKYSYEIVYLIIQYIYTGAITIRGHLVMQLLEASEDFGIKQLQNSCFDLLMKTVDTETVCKSIIEAKKPKYKFDTSAFIEKCIQLIQESTSEIVETDGFYELDESEMLQLIKNDKLCIDEGDLFLALLEWAKKRCKLKNTSVQEELKIFVPYLKFPLMSAVDLISVVKPLNIIDEDTMIEAMEYNAAPDDVVIDENNFRFKPRGPITR